jgi:hypothetical protein
MLVLSTARDYALVASADRPYVRAPMAERPPDDTISHAADDEDDDEVDEDEDEDGVPATPFAMACIYGRANVVRACTRAGGRAKGKGRLTSTPTHAHTQIEVYVNAGLLLTETDLARHRLAQLLQLCRARGHAAAAAALADCMQRGAPRTLLAPQSSAGADGRSHPPTGQPPPARSPPPLPVRWAQTLAAST